MYLLDTNILILYLAGDLDVVRFIDEARTKKSYLAVSVITSIELLSFRAIQEEDEVIISRLLDELHVLSLRPDLAHLIAALRRKTGLKLGDATIAATAQSTNLTLLTRDRELVKKLGQADIDTMVI